MSSIPLKVIKNGKRLQRYCNADSISLNGTMEFGCQALGAAKLEIINLFLLFLDNLFIAFVFGSSCGGGYGGFCLRLKFFALGMAFRISCNSLTFEASFMSALRCRSSQ